MKKKLAALLALTLSVIALTACGEENTTSESSTGLTTFTPSVELVKVEGDVIDLSVLPVEEYVTLGEYKGLTAEVTAKQEISDEIVDSTMMNYYYQHGTSYLVPEDFTTTEGTVTEKDFVLIDFEGKKDGVAFEGGTSEDFVLGIGSGSFIEGFETGLVGVLVGETVELNLPFPENYGNEELAGQPVVFTVTVKSLLNFSDDVIKKFEIPEIETLEDYRAEVEAMLNYEVEGMYMEEVNAALYGQLMAACPVTKIPESIYNRQKEMVEQQVISEAAYYQMDAEEYANAAFNMSVSDYACSFAEGYTIQAVVLQAIANAEGLVVAQEEIDAFVEEYVTTYGADYGIDSVEAFYETNTVEDVKEYLLQEKVIAFVTENAVITEK